MSIYTIIEQLKSTRSSNEKIDILRANVDNVELKTFFRLALCPFTNFYMKRELKYVPDAVELNITDAFYQLENVVAARKVTGDRAAALCMDLMASSSNEDVKIIRLILDKSSGCDLGASTINKIWPKLIPTWPCLLATAYDDKLAAKLNWVKGVFSQLKSDGGRVNIVVDMEGGVKLFSRAGNELNVSGAFDHLGEYFKGFVLDGEMLAVLPNGKFADRQTGNGLFNSVVINKRGKQLTAMKDQLCILMKKLEELQKN